jgi:Mce-associated membrane protein
VQREGKGRLRAATRLVGVLLIVPAVASLILWLRQPAASTTVGGAAPLTGPVARTALAAARSAAHEILSYDYRNISTDISHAESLTTGAFAQQYASTAKRLLSEAKQERTIVQATVGSAGVVSATPQNVVALLFVDQATVRQAAGQASPTTRIDQSRVRMTMTLTRGHWLVSQLDAL